MGETMISILPEFVQNYCDGIVIGDCKICHPQLLNDFESKGRIEPIYNHQSDNLGNLRLAHYNLFVEKENWKEKMTYEVMKIKLPDNKKDSSFLRILLPKISTGRISDIFVSKKY
jgi:hypothetical protein